MAKTLGQTNNRSTAVWDDRYMYDYLWHILESYHYYIWNGNTWLKIVTTSPQYYSFDGCNEHLLLQGFSDYWRNIHAKDSYVYKVISWATSYDWNEISHMTNMLAMKSTKTPSTYASYCYIYFDRSLWVNHEWAVAGPWDLTSAITGT